MLFQHDYILSMSCVLYTTHIIPLAIYVQCGISDGAITSAMLPMRELGIGRS